MKKEPIGKLISYIHRSSQKILAKRLAPHGIGSGGQYSFLKAVLHSPGINQDQLTHKLKFDKATTARSIKQLEQSGYISRTPDPNDRRSQLVYPTIKAKQFAPVLQSILDDFNQRLVLHLNKEEEELLLGLLHKIGRSIESDDEPQG
ncbi:Multiple antibiotic resistance protein MarR [Paenibacillus konkukensis]|uniref:Multiple antibiotic resistance protein MarR n=1 Tax=Paenibacillus konkukensis TaxID=2020716 RepID=A0ABY4RW74_9BACL|nr:MarR family transcriptional regulator [Paenibacillus konkukensis]UQZ86904.1 Multiple antibiotic resistance protein MarR [Paenibacillus konkukensis]